MFEFYDTKNAVGYRAQFKRQSRNINILLVLLRNYVSIPYHVM